LIRKCSRATIGRPREWKHAPISSSWEVAASPAAPRDEPFEVLPCCDHRPLAIHLRQGAQPEPSQAVPLLALTKQWFNPDLAFLIGLFVRVGLVICHHAVQILLNKSCDGACAHPCWWYISPSMYRHCSLPHRRDYDGSDSRSRAAPSTRLFHSDRYSGQPRYRR
jgi:hypothetical protein